MNLINNNILLFCPGLPHNDVVPRLNEKVMSFKQVMPGITSLRNPYLKARHWEEIEKLIGRAIDRDKSFTLGNLLEMNVRVFLVVADMHLKVAIQFMLICLCLYLCLYPNNDLDHLGSVGHDSSCVEMSCIYKCEHVFPIYNAPLKICKEAVLL